MVPSCGLMDHVTPAVEFCTVAVNCCVWLLLSVTVSGVTVTEVVGAACSVMVAVPDFAGSSMLVAVTVTREFADVMVGGAVYKPELSIAPCCGLIDHVTVAVAFCRVAVNCCDWLLLNVTVAGETATDTGGDACSVTVDEADLPGSSRLVAVTVTFVPAEMNAGAVYSPPALMLPC